MYGSLDTLSCKVGFSVSQTTTCSHQPVLKHKIPFLFIQHEVDDQHLTEIMCHSEDQCSVAEWLRWWANLGVITELLGGRGFESHSRHE